ncbi:ethylene-responsive transcription factor ERF011-like [Andrographis paniculata]|uniref:ethylene-responsive transcription factor ERF011-like n=1 Tax=Andrographis paniculata TaxID=175694 RepID=UPI0021E8B25E|nr:ethylene-responsive transcription factor ERF011-like [Andrographis paniculata]
MEVNAAAAASASRRRNEKPYKGIRMRKWGKWVAEIREPNKRSRIWLGSYCTAVAAARAYDTAVYYLRGPTAKLNFPDQISVSGLTDLSAASIRQKAIEVGSRVDALHSSHRSTPPPPPPPPQEHGGVVAAVKPEWLHEGIDLNKKPEPEDPADHW